jgi:hypothetical protein
MADRLKEEGVEKSWSQIQKKLDNLKHQFKKNSPGPTGSSPSSWPFYSQIHEILQSSHYFNEEMAHTVESEVRKY